MGPLIVLAIMLYCCGLILYFEIIVVMTLIKKYIFFKFFILVSLLFFSPLSAPPADDGAPSICLYCLCPELALVAVQPKLNIFSTTLMWDRRRSFRPDWYEGVRGPCPPFAALSNCNLFIIFDGPTSLFHSMHSLCTK